MLGLEDEFAAQTGTEGEERETEGFDHEQDQHLKETADVGEARGTESTPTTSFDKNNKEDDGPLAGLSASFFADESEVSTSTKAGNTKTEGGGDSDDFLSFLSSGRGAGRRQGRNREAPMVSDPFERKRDHSDPFSGVESKAEGDRLGLDDLFSTSSRKKEEERPKAATTESAAKKTRDVQDAVEKPSVVPSEPPLTEEKPVPRAVSLGPKNESNRAKDDLLAELFASDPPPTSRSGRRQGGKVGLNGDDGKEEPSKQQDDLLAELFPSDKASVKSSDSSCLWSRAYSAIFNAFESRSGRNERA
ncbi:hypothetical protein PINS_up012178 [Pythium insidiosum]|nr:hypothetical protein PINS_up012178 [Pythium insidiosum]